MRSLTVRKIEDEVYERLKERAADEGVSMEELVRQLIERAVAPPRSLAELAVECFGEESGVELEMPERAVVEPVDLDR